MKRSPLIASLVAVALLVASFAAKNGGAQTASAQGNFTITTAFTRDPPKRGTETLTITVKDPSGAPVKGADVKITTSMPSMSMAGPSARASDNRDGTYTATLPLKFATRWTFTITVSSNGKSAHAEVSKDVR